MTEKLIINQLGIPENFMKEPTKKGKKKKSNKKKKTRKQDLKNSRNDTTEYTETNGTL